MVYFDIVYKRQIPNELTISTILVSGIFGLLFFGVKQTLVGVMLALFWVYLLYHFKLWGGADCKIMIALTALLSYTPELFAIVIITLSGHLLIHILQVKKFLKLKLSFPGTVIILGSFIITALIF